MKDESRPSSSFIPHPSSFQIAAIATVFLAARLAILAARDPFFDELFTLWMSRQPLANVIPNLLHDSGPPLYYFLARLDSITGLRLLSLLFAAVQFAIVVRRTRLGALMLALYPPAALLATDARAYALCAMFVTAGVVALESERPFLAAFAFALAAHSHYYGVLFFPLLLLRRHIYPFLTAVFLFIPGFVLAFLQPVEAMKWNREPLFAPLANLSFAGMYPYALFASAPLLVAAAALVLLVIVLGRSTRYAAAVLVPLALIVAFHVAGRPVYFPMRFEAVIAGPLALWLGEALSAWDVTPRRWLAAALGIIGAVAVGIGVADHLQRPLDPYRQAAAVLAQQVAPNEVVVATGYLYLETVVALHRPVVAFPPEQAQHPGWRATVKPNPRALPPGPFIWIGERYAPEIATLRGVKALRPLFWNSRTLIAKVDTLTLPVH